MAVLNVLYIKSLSFKFLTIVGNFVLIKSCAVLVCVIVNVSLELLDSSYNAPSSAIFVVV